MVVGTRFGLSLGIAQVEVFASAAAKAAVLEAERAAQVAAGVPVDLVHRPMRLSELLVTSATTRAGVQAVLADVAEAQAELHALQAAAISRLAELQPAQTVLPGARPDDAADPDRPDDWVADEVAVVLGISVGSASALVAKQRALFEQLPGVWVALADGRIDVRRAQVLVDGLADRKQSAGGGLPDDVVDAIAAQGLGWIGEGVGPTPLADRIAGAVIAADPAEADRRAERRKRRQNVTSLSQGDGLAGLRTDLADAADVADELEVIDALAAAMRKNGDKRPMGQLRVAAHHQLVTRPWEPLPADVAAVRWQLRLRVDLADLDHLGPVLNPPEQPTPPNEAEVEEDAAVDDGPAVEEESPKAPLQPTPTPDDGAALLDDTRLTGGSGVASIGGLTVSPVAVAELLARYEALLVTGPRGWVDGGEVWFEIVDATGRLRALTSPTQARAADHRGTGLAPPPAVDRYSPSAEQVRFVRARDQHCRFPGCHRPAEYVDLDHVTAYDHDDPAAGGPTCVTNLVCLCRRHHRLKTHAPGWVFAMDPDGTLHVTPPGGCTRTTRPDRIAEVDMSTPSHLQSLTDLLGPTPKRYRSPTPEKRAARRATAAERARLAADIEAELTAAAARLAAEHGAEQVDDRPEQSIVQDRDRDPDPDPCQDQAGDDPPPF
ncbi:HNH endonuclease signature motif containing protein [Klenkia soli]|uniref:HNH endonuclease signature motif containing protein n=1 Tax=Klenkia soli TaxID=1052260 RepID=UPI00104218B9|nr:HNH endonuclease signature motif containing protein [Klenkia soli]